MPPGCSIYHLKELLCLLRNYGDEWGNLPHTIPVIGFPLLLPNWQLGLKVRKMLSLSWSKSFLPQDSYK